MRLCGLSREDQKHRGRTGLGQWAFSPLGTIFNPQQHSSSRARSYVAYLRGCSFRSCGYVVVEDFQLSIQLTQGSIQAKQVMASFFCSHSLSPPSNIDQWADRSRGTSTYLQLEENGEKWLGECIWYLTHFRMKCIFILKIYDYLIASTFQSLVL